MTDEQRRSNAAKKGARTRQRREMLMLTRIKEQNSEIVKLRKELDQYEERNFELKCVSCFLLFTAVNLVIWRIVS